MKLLVTLILIVYCGAIKGQNSVGVIFSTAGTRCSEVWFIKLNEDQDLLDVEYVIKSKFHKGSQVYLTDIKDGKYAMVASMFYMNGADYTTYFDEDLIRRTIFKVDSGKFFFLGKWVVKSLSMVGKEKKGDEVSQHFFNMIGGEIRNASFGKMFTSGNVHYRGEFKNVEISAELIKDFKQRALKHYRKDTLMYNKINKFKM